MADVCKLDKLKSFFDAIDCPGGHIVTCLVIGAVGIILTVGGMIWLGTTPDIVDLILRITTPLAAFLPIAAYAMRGTEKANGKTVQTTTSTVETKTTIPAPPSTPTPPPAEPAKEPEQP